MSQRSTTTDLSHIARAADCPVCHGAGELPSMTAAGLTNPCPRCVVVPPMPDYDPADVAFKPAGVDPDPTPDLDRYGFPPDFLAGLVAGAVIVAVAVGFLRWAAA